MKSVKENIWKKWRNSREREMIVGKELKEIDITKSLEEKFERLGKIKERLMVEELERKERAKAEREKKRNWLKEKEEARQFIR